MDEVLYERRGLGGWLRLNRPEEMNSLTPAMISRLAEHIDRARVDKEVRALVITGSGRAFCAGGDLKAVRQLAGIGSTRRAPIPHRFRVGARLPSKSPETRDCGG
jgi:enoyl-CoA hydratase